MKTMSEMNQKKQLQPKKRGNALVAAVTGAVMGAGIALAGVAALKNKNSRVKVKNSLANAKKQAKVYLEGVRKQIKHVKEEVQKDLKKENDITKKKLGVKKGNK
jgi:hypothetical protein